VDVSEYVAIGLMSGTSVDSVDAAAVRIEQVSGQTNVELIKGLSYPIPSELRAEIFQLFDEPPGSLHRLALLNIRVGLLLAEAATCLLEEANLSPKEVAVIGSHGQTVHHVAESEICCGEQVRGSLQIGEAALIAQRTGIPVVSDFRMADIAAGGTGAPLVPFLDFMLFKDYPKEVAAQNLGGIGNVTWIPKGNEPLIAFDTGPGNMIIDMVVDRYTGGALHFDRDGEIGRKGRINAELLEKWMNHPYFIKEPPKSAGREEFGTLFWKKHLKFLELSPDIVRTAEAFTAHSVAQAYRQFLPRLPASVVLTGGGARNPVIRQILTELLEGSEVLTGDEVGIDVDFKEAIAFALLGLYRILGRTNNVPEATGAKRTVVLGKLSIP
jgi:anhydro-N-acetylmuramic acid kinase